MEGGLGDGGQSPRPPTRRLRLCDRLARPVVGGRVEVCQLRKAEALPDPPPQCGGDGVELGAHCLGPRRLAKITLEPGVPLLPLAAGLVESDRHLRGTRLIRDAATRIRPQVADLVQDPLAELVAWP